MKRDPAWVLALALIVLAGLSVAGVLPVHAQSDFTVTNKFVVNGSVSSNIGIPDGGLAKGQITATNLVSGTDNSIFLSYTLNATGPLLPTVSFTPDPVILSAAVNSANTTMKIVVDNNVLHGAYHLSVNATSGTCPACFTHFLFYDIKVYTIAVTIDPQSTSPTDTCPGPVQAPSCITPSTSASEAATFRVGVMVANATNTLGTNPKCTVAFPCSLSAFGWSFGLTYDPAVLVPQGDPNPAATPGNSLGLYVDGAQNTVLFGGQTSIGEGTASWASIASSGNAFPVTQFLPGEVVVAYTLKAPLTAAFLASTTGRFLLASVSFELLQKPASPTIVSINTPDLAFSDDFANPECTCVISTIANQGATATETITNAPPTASFTATPLPAGDSSCATIYTVDASGCTAYAFRLDASSSSDPEGTALAYTWDFGDTSRDSAAEFAAGCPVPDADKNCVQGITAVHDFGAVASLGGSPPPPSTYLVSLRVTDASGATGSARDLSGNAISNSQPSHATKIVTANVNPTPSFTVTPSSPGLSQTVTFDASASTDDGTIASYRWNFGDSSPIVTTTPPTSTTTHSYTMGGTFSVTLTVNDTLGGSGSTLKTVVVTDVAPSLTLSPSANPVAGQTFTLTLAASDSDGSVSSVQIDWGDGTTPTSVTGNPTSGTHTYANPGTFKITVTVTDNGGKTTVQTSTITVAAASSGVFSSPLLYGIIGAVVAAVAVSILLLRRRGKNAPSPSPKPA